MPQKSIHTAVTLLMWQLFSAPLSAAVPEQIEGVETVDAERVIELVASHPNITLIDSRISANRKHGYIEGSLPLPDTKTTCDSLAAIVPDKQAEVIFYCNGIKCGRSVKAIAVAKRCGYRHLFWFRGGFVEWQAKGYPSLKR